MRRNYVIGILAIAVIVIGAYLWQASRPKTNGDMLSGGNDVKIESNDVAYFRGATGYFVRPDDDNDYPGIVMIHENRGLRDEIKTMAEELAQEGYLVLAVDLFGKTVETQEEAQALTANFDQQNGIENLKAAIAYLKNQGADKIASIGWCFGGGQSLQLGLSGEKMDATVIYYGRLATSTTQLAPIKWPVLGIFGDKDQVVPVESVNQFDAALDNMKVDNQIYIYPGVGHAFANPSGTNYAPNETRDAWNKTVGFLNEKLK